MALGDMSEKQLLGLTAGVVGAVLLVMGGILFWIYLRYKGLLDDIRVKGAEYAKIEKEARTLEDKKAELKETQARSYDAFKKAPNESEETDLDAQISEQAANAKLKIVKIEQVKERRRVRSDEKKKSKLEAIRLRIEAAGSFNSIGQFLNNIERNMDRFVAVTDFKITAHEDGLIRDMEAHEIKIGLVTYRYSDKKPAGAGR